MIRKKNKNVKINNVWEFLHYNGYIAVILILVIGFILTFRFSCDKTGVTLNKDPVKLPTQFKK